jgi:energy-converting hydrogenase Eha subunit A
MMMSPVSFAIIGIVFSVIFDVVVALVLGLIMKKEAATPFN